FLVADPDPIDTLVAADRVRYRVQRVAHDAPHVCDSVTGEGVNDRFGNGGHGCLPSGGCRSSVTDSARPGEGVDGAAAATGCGKLPRMVDLESLLLHDEDQAPATLVIVCFSITHGCR